MKKVVAKCRPSRRRGDSSGVVYCELTDAVTGDVVLATTLEDCISTARYKKYEIVNSQDVLNWIQQHGDVKAYNLEKVQKH